MADTHASTLPLAARQVDHHRWLALWLLVCAGLLLALILVGGATRLTGSGLSIVEWKPVTGVLPPFTDAQWQAELELYRQSPEYQLVNRGMSMSEFKFIFWFEYGHRLLARLLGLAFAIPLAFFWWRRWLPQEMKTPLLILLALGFAQAYMGWYMVQSGLVDEPRVSHYRLAAHLTLALLIFAGLVWLALALLWPPQVQRRVLQAPPWLLLLVSVTLLWGAFVAGLKAGYLYNTFPLMAGQWLPPEGMALTPGWRNLLDNPATVQFIHRVLGVGTLLVLAGYWYFALRQELASRQRLTLHLMLVIAVVQVSLGIATLLLRVPVILGVVHQGVAVLLLTVVLALWQQSRPEQGAGHVGSQPA